MVFITQILFYGMCWLDWGGRQAVLFHLAERKFYIFGMVFWRRMRSIWLFCWSSRPIYSFSHRDRRASFLRLCLPANGLHRNFHVDRAQGRGGDRSARRKLDLQPMSARKARLKTVKHLLWLLVAAWTGFTFVGYFTPVRDLASSIANFSLGGWEVFWLFFYSGFLYFMAGFMREQMCKFLCPYARFQGVMFDPDTLIITYDAERGEPRGVRRKQVDAAAPALGDCVDCGVLRTGLPDRHRYSRWPAIRMHRLCGLHRRLRLGHG